MYSLGLPAWSTAERVDRDRRARRGTRAAALSRRVELALCARRTLEDVEAEIRTKMRQG
jgi:hypothetical protein